MARAKCSYFLLFFIAIIICRTVSAQTPRTITVRILDSKTGSVSRLPGFWSGSIMSHPRTMSGCGKMRMGQPN